MQRLPAAVIIPCFALNSNAEYEGAMKFAAGYQQRAAHVLGGFAPGNYTAQALAAYVVRGVSVAADKCEFAERRRVFPTNQHPLLGENAACGLPFPIAGFPRPKREIA